MIDKEELESLLSLADTAAGELEAYLVSIGVPAAVASKATSNLYTAVHEAEGLMGSRKAGYDQPDFADYCKVCGCPKSDHFEGYAECKCEDCAAFDKG